MTRGYFELSENKELRNKLCSMIIKEGFGCI